MSNAEPSIGKESCRPTGSVATRELRLLMDRIFLALKAIMCESLVVSQLVVMEKQMKHNM